MNLSIIVPTIRTHLWDRFIDSVKRSCTQYDWEIIFCGPFCNESLLDYRIKFIKSFYTVPVSIQLAILKARGDLVFQTVDDGILLDNALDVCLKAWYLDCSNIKIMNMRYSEGPNFAGNIRTADQWKVKNCPEFNLDGINQEWSTSVQPLMSTALLKTLGGLDCRWEYSNHPHHDLIFRAQSVGSIVTHSPVGVSKADHMPEETGDHKPIHNAQHADEDLFNKLWSTHRNPLIKLDNYLEHLQIWQRRFSKEYNSYREMAEQEGYKV